MSYVDHIAYWESGRKVDNPLGPFDCGASDFPQVYHDLNVLKDRCSRTSIAQGPTSLWRYADVLPIDDPNDAVSLGEGWTPMLAMPRIGETLGLVNLLAKDEGRNPSGTFKDRGASVAVSRLKELGVKTVVLNSSGNAGGSWAMYAARAGIRCINLLPEDVLPASLQQCVLSGASTFILDGPWSEASRLVAESARTNGWMDMRTLKEPYRLEGKKTMGYEIAEQLDWALPDAIAYPCGGGLGAIAIYKAFREMQEIGWVPQGPLPILIITQYEGCAPIVQAFDEDIDHAKPWADLDVLPGGLKSPYPSGDKAVLQLIRETAGTAIAVSAEDSLRTAESIAKLEGIFVCPESATTLSGLRKAVDAGVVHSGDCVVAVITGNGLKSVPVFDDALVRKIGPHDSLGTDKVRKTNEKHF